MKTLVEIMARSVGARPQKNKNCDVEYLLSVEALEQLIELVRADEREACAKVCDGVQDCGPENGCCPTYWNESLERAAAAIRARSNT